MVVGKQTMVVGGMTVLGVIGALLADSILLVAHVSPELVTRLSTSGIRVTGNVNVFNAKFIFAQNLLNAITILARDYIRNVFSTFKNFCPFTRLQ